MSVNSIKRKFNQLDSSGHVYWLNWILNTTNMKSGQLFTALILINLSPGSQGEIFRWTDANGEIHFSDQKPENRHFETLKESPPQTFNTPKNVETENPQNPASISNKKPSNPDKKPRPDAALCADINIELDTLKRTEAVFKDEQERYHTHRSTFSRLYQGDRQYIHDNDRQAAIDKVEQQLKTQCDTSEEFQREMSIATGKLIKSRECDLLDQFYSDQQQQKYRMTHSDLRLLKKKIDEHCSATNTQPIQQNIEDLLDPDNLLKAR